MRTCKTTTCQKSARRQGTYCELCHKRNWRANNRGKARVSERARIFTPAERQQRNARATVAVYVQRGKLARQGCHECGRAAAPHSPDLERPVLGLVWLCRAHRSRQRDREAASRQEFARVASRAARVVRYASLRERFSAEWPALSESQRAEITTLASSDPLVRGVSRESPLFRQSLIRAFGAHGT